MDNKQYSIDMFKAAREEIYFLMSKDNFARFRKSKFFEQLLTDVQAYEASIVDQSAVETANRRLSEQNKNDFGNTFDEEFHNKRNTKT